MAYNEILIWVFATNEILRKCVFFIYFFVHFTKILIQHVTKRNKTTTSEVNNYFKRKISIIS